MTLQALPQGNFFNRLYTVLANDAGEAFEGALWGLFLGLQVCSLSSSLSARNAAYALPETDLEKTDKVWKANKNLFTSTLSLTSISAITYDWLKRINVISFGSFLNKTVACVGYGGQALLSSINLWDHLQELGGIKEGKGLEGKTKTQRKIEVFLKIVLDITFIAWSVLGVAFSLFGGAGMFAALDAAFFYVALLVLANVTYMWYTKLPEKIMPPEMKNANGKV